jgi:hypothetical protein
MATEAVAGLLIMALGVGVALLVVFLVWVWNVTGGVRCPACDGRDCWLKVREETVGVRRIKKVHTFRGGYSGSGYGDSYYDSQGHYHSGHVSVSGSSWHQQQVDALRYEIDVYYQCSRCSFEEVQRAYRDSLDFEV